MGVVLKRARYFVTCGGKFLETKEYDSGTLRRKLTSSRGGNIGSLNEEEQMLLFPEPVAGIGKQPKIPPQLAHTIQ
jgi:hypothetical protein